MGLFDYSRNTRVILESGKVPYSNTRLVYWNFDANDPHLTGFQRWWVRNMRGPEKLKIMEKGWVYPRVKTLESSPKGKREFEQLKARIKTYDDVLRQVNTDYQGTWT